MRRLAFLVPLVAVVLVGDVAGGAPNVTAEEGTLVAANRGFVGSWRLTVSPPVGQPHPGLVTFTADGTLAIADVPAQPAPPGAPFPAMLYSGGHGVWETTGADTAAFTFDLLLATAQGAPLGVIASRGTAVLGVDRRALDGTYTGVVTDPSGNVVGSGQGTFRGDRMTVEPPGTATAAPPATGTPAP